MKNKLNCKKYGECQRLSCVSVKILKASSSITEEIFQTLSDTPMNKNRVAKWIKELFILYQKFRAEH